MSNSEAGTPAVPPGAQRAGDSDRKRVADRLRVALDEGRLDLNEYDERLQSAYLAKTYDELDALLADIPGPATPEQSQLRPREDRDPKRRDRRGPHHCHGRRDKSLKQIWGGLASAALLFCGIWLVTWIVGGGGPPYFWPAWVLGFWALGAVSATWSAVMKDSRH